MHHLKKAFPGFEAALLPPGVKEFLPGASLSDTKVKRKKEVSGKQERKVSQHFSFRLEELAAGDQAEKVGPPGVREGKSTQNREALYCARTGAEMLPWRFPS